MSNDPALVATTTKDYLKEKWDNFLQYNPAFKLLKKKGKIRTGCGGTSVDWSVKVGRYAPTSTLDFEDISDQINRKNQYVRANQAWGQLLVTDATSNREFRLQTAEQTLRNLMQERIPQMATDLMDEGIASNLLNNASGTGQVIGLPAIIPTITPDAADKSTDPADQTNLAVSGTYAGLSVARSGLTGVDNAEADAWSPTLLNLSGSDWSSATLLDKYSYAITLGHKGSRSDHRIDCGILRRSQFQLVKDALRDSERIIVGVGDSGKEFGLGSSIEWVPFDGVSITWDENMPATYDYFLNFDQIHLDVVRTVESLSGDKAPGGKSKAHSDMFQVECAYLPNRLGMQITAEFIGQFRISPKHQVICGDFTS